LFPVFGYALKISHCRPYGRPLLLTSLFDSMPAVPGEPYPLEDDVTPAPAPAPSVESISGVYNVSESSVGLCI